MNWKDLKVGGRYEFRAANLPGFEWFPFTLVRKNYSGRTYSTLDMQKENGEVVRLQTAMYHIERGHIRELQRNHESAFNRGKE